MEFRTFILLFCLSPILQAQDAVNNYGNMYLHGASVGLHIDLANNGTLDQNLGLVGFYGDSPLTVSGAFAPTLYDAEFANENGVFLQTGIHTTNNTNFVIGNVVTPRDRTDVYHNFLSNAFFTGEGNISKVDGYVAITSQQTFTFPVGDADQLRQLILNSDSINTMAKCAYFYENPNTPSTFGISFDTGAKSRDISTISVNEFWRLEGSVPSTIQIMWNERSDIGALTDDISEMVPVGWSKSTNRWESLGGSAMGDLRQGFVTSDSFVPNDYEVITFGASSVPREFIDLDNYIVTPNGDGINDVLEIPELAQSPNNHMQIFDRNGSKVFDKVNYTNEFDGFATTNNFVTSRDKGLPSGVYFYIVSMDDLNLDFQGFLYLAND